MAKQFKTIIGILILTLILFTSCVHRVKKVYHKSGDTLILIQETEKTIWWWEGD